MWTGHVCISLLLRYRELAKKKMTKGKKVKIKTNDHTMNSLEGFHFHKAPPCAVNNFVLPLSFFYVPHKQACIERKGGREGATRRPRAND